MPDGLGNLHGQPDMLLGLGKVAHITIGKTDVPARYRLSGPVTDLLVDDQALLV